MSVFSKLLNLYDFDKPVAEAEPVAFLDAYMDWEMEKEAFACHVATKLPSNVEVLSQSEDEVIIRVRRTRMEPWGHDTSEILSGDNYGDD